MIHCYFDKRGIWHECDNLPDADCIGCKYERIIARSCTTLCQWCGKEISARTLRNFCSQQHRNNFLTESLSYNKGIDGSPFYGEPSFTIEQVREIQKQMFGMSIVYS